MLNGLKNVVLCNLTRNDITAAMNDDRLAVDHILFGDKTGKSSSMLFLMLGVDVITGGTSTSIFNIHTRYEVVGELS